MTLIVLMAVLDNRTHMQLFLPVNRDETIRLGQVKRQPQSTQLDDDAAVVNVVDVSESQAAADNRSSKRTRAVDEIYWSAASELLIRVGR